MLSSPLTHQLGHLTTEQLGALISHEETHLIRDLDTLSRDRDLKELCPHTKMELSSYSGQYLDEPRGRGSEHPTAVTNVYDAQ